MKTLAASLRWIARLVLLGIFALAVGFFIFAESINNDRLPNGRNADGIVALTGGKARIGEAVRLLADGRAQRMLITGVNPKTTAEQIEALVPQSGRLFDCCIDLGREAEDTTGNAIEARDWIVLHQFSSVILVTSSYHMPRSLLELKRYIPETEIIPHSVEPSSFRKSRWWSNANVTRLIFSEYVKYLSALARPYAAIAGIQLSAKNAAGAEAAG